MNVQASRHRRLLYDAFGETQRAMCSSPTTYTVADADRLERAFPSCTAALDANPRIAQWTGHRFHLCWAGSYRHEPLPNQAASLVALRTNEHGAYVNTRTHHKVRVGALYFVELAVYVPSEERWVVIR